MTGAEEPAEIRFEVQLVNIETQLICIDRIFIAPYAVLIPVIARSHDTVEFVAENMLPLQGYILIAIGIGGVVVEIEVVFAEIARKIEVVLFIDLMTDIEVEIIEGSPAIMVLGRQILQEPVGIGRPAAEDKRGLVLDQRALYIQPARQQADTGRAGEVLFIAFAAVDVQHG